MHALAKEEKEELQLSMFKSLPAVIEHLYEVTG